MVVSEPRSGAKFSQRAPSAPEDWQQSTSLCSSLPLLLRRAVCNELTQNADPAGNRDCARFFCSIAIYLLADVCW